jgi:hypothetical protein
MKISWHLCYSDIFQLTPPLLRFCARLAGYGFVAAAPKSIAASSRPTALSSRSTTPVARSGQQDAAKTPVAHFDADCRSGLHWLATHPRVAPGKIGVVVSASAATSPSAPPFQPDVRDTVCYYGHRHPRRQSRPGPRRRFARPRQGNSRQSAHDASAPRIRTSLPPADAPSPAHALPRPSGVNISVSAHAPSPGRWPIDPVARTIFRRMMRSANPTASVYAT